MKTTSINIRRICLVAMAAAVNVVGGQIALLLRLPVYLDSIGTILVGALLGSFYGMLPNLLSGICMGLTTDIYSLYFAPAGMVMGLMAGVVFDKMTIKGRWIFPAALCVTLPSTVISALISAGLFGGVTSSGSTLLVQLLSKTPLGVVGSVIAVQILTDYLDRLISIFLVCAILKAMTADMRASLRKEK